MQAPCERFTIDSSSRVGLGLATCLVTIRLRLLSRRNLSALLIPALRFSFSHRLTICLLRGRDPLHLLFPSLPFLELGLTPGRIRGFFALLLCLDLGLLSGGLYRLSLLPFRLDLGLTAGCVGRFLALAFRLKLGLPLGDLGSRFALPLRIDLSLTPGSIRRLFALSLCLELGLTPGLRRFFAPKLCLEFNLSLGGIRRLLPAHFDQGGQLRGLGIIHAGQGRLPTCVFVPTKGATQYNRECGSNGQPPRR